MMLTAEDAFYFTIMNDPDNTYIFRKTDKEVFTLTKVGKLCELPIQMPDGSLKQVREVEWIKEITLREIIGYIDKHDKEQS
jgi:hypothetical protein